MADEEFNNIKDALLVEDTMIYFDPHWQSEVIVDASPVGLGAILLQEVKDGVWHPVAYASRALTDTELRYAHIE